MTTDVLPALAVERFSAPLRQRVESVLRDAIVSGTLAPGQRLTERELVEMTATSRTLVREALRQLEAERLIAVMPNKGAVVRELTVAEAKEIYAVRAVLEGLAARQFSEAADAAAMQKLRGAADAAIAAYEREDLGRALEYHNAFYDVLFEGAANDTLRSMLATLHARILRWRALGLMHSARSPGRSRETVRGLKNIVAAIGSGDADTAERATREHAERGATEVMKLIGKADTQHSIRARRRA
jgi:DNA-binding GntR family transcriptional regulator